MSVYTDIKFQQISVSAQNVTEEKEIPRNESMTVTTGAISITGSPTYTLQCSNDKVKWFDYPECLNIPYDDSLQFVVPYTFRFMRFKIETTGTGSLYFYVSVR